MYVCLCMNVHIHMPKREINTVDKSNIAKYFALTTRGHDECCPSGLSEIVSPSKMESIHCLNWMQSKTPQLHKRHAFRSPSRISIMSWVMYSEISLQISSITTLANNVFPQRGCRCPVAHQNIAELGVF